MLPAQSLSEKDQLIGDDWPKEEQATQEEYKKQYSEVHFKVNPFKQCIFPEEE